MKSELVLYRYGETARDMILCNQPKILNFVVVGESQESMIERGFSQMGSLPIFFLKGSLSEYHLANKPLKSSGKAEYDTNNISIHEHSSYADFTINSIFIDSDGQIEDPHKGMKDLYGKVIRRLSPDFSVSFSGVVCAARLVATLGFSIEDETMEAMKLISAKDLTKSIAKENLWRDFRKSLLSKRPSQFFKTLNDCGALEKLMPEIARLKSIHSVVTGSHTRSALDDALEALDRSAEATDGLEDDRAVRVRLAALLQHIGSGDITDNKKAIFMKLKDFCKTSGVPARFFNFIKSSAISIMKIKKLNSLYDPLVVDIFDDLDVKRVIKHDEFFLKDIFSSYCAHDFSEVSGHSLRAVPHIHDAESFELLMEKVNNMPVWTWAQGFIDTGMEVKEARKKAEGLRKDAMEG